MSRRLFSRAPTTVSLRLRFDRPPHQRHGDLPPAGDERTGDRLGRRLEVVHRAGHHDLAAVLAGARPDVHHPVGGPDRVLVVLDDDQGVAEIAQPGQRLDQPVVVPLVQPDRRFVQHVQHADQPGADLGGQPDPLRLAAGQGGRPAGSATGSRGRRRAGIRAGRSTSLSTRSAIIRSRSDSTRPGKNAAASLIDIAESWAMFCRPSSACSMVTARISGLSRVPWHDGHGTSRMYPSYFSRANSESVCAARRSRNGMTPSNSA